MTEQPMALYQTAVRPEWVDHNGHMNVAFYATLFDRALEAFFEHVGIGQSYAKQSHCTLFVVESHFTYQHEVLEGDPLSIRLQLLDRDRKRVHCFMELYQERDKFLAATSEQIAVHVDLSTRKSLSMPATALTRLSSILESHLRIARPKEVGHKIGIRQRRRVPAVVQ